MRCTREAQPARISICLRELQGPADLGVPMDCSNRCFIVNPRARKGQGLRHWQKIASQIPDIEHKSVFICEDWDQLKSKACLALDEGYQEVYAVGGDGTAAQVAAAFIERPNNLASLGVLPTGSGCDYYRSISGGLRPLDYLQKSQTMAVDVFKIGFDDRVIFGLNSASVGITADIVARKDKLSSWIPTALSYALPTIRSFLSYQTKTWALKIDEKDYSQQFLAIMVCKGFYAGGGMKLGESAALASGNLAISLVPPLSGPQFLRHAPQLYSQGLRKMTPVTALDGHSLRIEMPIPFALEVDGELYEGRRLDISVLPKAFQLKMVDSK